MSNTENIRCRKCRYILLSGEEIVLCNAHNKSISDVCESDQACATVQDQNCFYMSDEVLPQFISDAVTEASWTKGKILCPGCQAKLGLFNFVSSIKCSCNLSTLPSVHLLASKVDWMRPNELMKHAVSVPNQDPTSLENAILAARNKSSLSSQTDFPSVPQSASTPGASSACSDTNKEVKNQIVMLDLLTQELSKKCDEDDEDYYTDDDEEEANYTDNLILSGPQGRKIRRDLKRRQRKEKNKAKAEKRLQEKIVWEKEKKLRKEAEEEESSRIPGHLTCPICLDLMHNPCRTQPCKHIFCEPCLRQMGGENKTCPLCREVIGQCKPDKDITQEIKDNFPVLYSMRQEFERKSNRFDRPLPWTKEHRFNPARRRWNLDIQTIRNTVMETYTTLPTVQKIMFWGLVFKISCQLAMRIYRRFFTMEYYNIEEILENDLTKDLPNSRIKKYPSEFYQYFYNRE